MSLSSVSDRLLSLKSTSLTRALFEKCRNGQIDALVFHGVIHRLYVI